MQLLNITGIAKNFGNGYIGSWTAGVDHDFGDFKFIPLMWRRPEFIWRGSTIPNSLRRSHPGIRSVHAVRYSPCHAIGGFGPEVIMTSGSHSTYHALQTSLSKNSARAGLGVQASYTYSKSLDDTSAVLGGLFGASGTILQTAPQNPWNPSAEKGPSTFDVTHVFSASVIQLLPLDRVEFSAAAGQRR